MIFQWTTFVMKMDYLPADKSPFLTKFTMLSARILGFSIAAKCPPG